MSESTAISGEGRKLRADAERNRLRIIEAARDLFAERGLDVTLDDIAVRAGVGIGTVYRRFANRDELIVGVLSEHLNAVASESRAALDDPDPWHAMVSVLTHLVSSMAGDRGLATLLMQISHDDPEIMAAKAEMIAAMRQVFVRAQAEGVVRADLAESDFYGILTMLKSIAELAAPVAPDLWRRYLDLILEGIKAPGTLPLSGPIVTEDQIREMQECWRVNN